MAVTRLAARRLRPRTGWPVAVAVAVAACADAPEVVVPVIDLPVGDPDATAAGLDAITLRVAHAGSDADLTSQTFARGAPLSLANVPFGDDLVIHMSGTIGASNVAYGRTCTVAVTPGGTPPSPHLFFSRSVRFATLDATPVARLGGLGVDYLGTAILIGGDDANGAPVTAVERFDPATGRLGSLGQVSARDRAVEALVGTAAQRVVVLGGAIGAAGATFVEVIDDRGIDRREIPQIARIDLTATTLTDGRALVAGGAAPDTNLPSAELDVVSDDGAAVDVRKLDATLRRARAGHTATRLGDQVGAPVLIAGGVDAAGAPVADAELFRPLSDDTLASFGPVMAIPRHRHAAAVMPDGSVLIIGGLDASGAPVRTLELFSVAGGFVPVGELPAGAGVVDFAATTLPDGRILLTGGRATPTDPPLGTAYIARLDPRDGQIDLVTTDQMQVARAGHQATSLCDGTVLITGGALGPSPAERYNPPPLGRR